MKLHRGSEEGGVAKDIEDILTGRHEDGFTLMNLYAIDIGFSPKTDHDDERIAVEITNHIQGCTKCIYKCRKRHCAMLHCSTRRF